jgi:3-deoxy-7-phosphoheptulonate synthase
MLIVMTAEATAEQIAHVCDIIQKLGYAARPIPGGVRTAIGVVGNQGAVDHNAFAGLEGVARAIPVSAPYKLVSREFHPASTVIELSNGARIGGGEVCLMAGPCSVETEAQVMETAARVAQAGAVVLRGGAYKPRTSPYAFQGLGVPGLKLLAKAGKAHGLATITEALDHESAEAVAEHADIIQIGARNMQNFSLLKRVGRMSKPVVVKRGMSATLKEWLLAAEYVMNAGNEAVILCERGIRSFDSATRNVLDLATMALAQKLSHLPVIADPSHGTGRRDMVVPMTRAAVAAGADGVIVEVHPNPEVALSDGHQALLPDQFDELVAQVRVIAGVVDRRLSTRG